VNANRSTALIFGILAAIIGLLIARSHGPAPKPSWAPPQEFSAERAITTLHTILQGDLPHPVGSLDHEEVRQRIVTQLRGLGYEPAVQQTFTCNGNAACAPVANIMARLPGDVRAETLMVTAHYDSVVAGPGVTDDGVGFASILEVARAVRHQRFRNTILFIITDAEEAGLIGAEGLMADPALLRGVAGAINVDNRGTSGESYLFETSRHNRWLLPIIARALPRPAFSSLFYNIYEMLPNDTDMSVFKRAGLAGVNFASIGRVAHYHTPLDNLGHVTPSTVQDHGEHILAMTRALANADLRQATADDAVFFDIASLFIVWWPQPWTKLMAAGALVVLIVAAAIRSRDGETSAAAITAGVITFFASIAGAVILGTVAAWIASLSALGATWVAQPGPSIAAMWLIGVATAIVAAGRVRTMAGFDGLFLGYGLCWTVIGIALIRFLPGGSYLAIVPAMAFAVCMTLRATLGMSEIAAAIVCATVTALLHFRIALVLHDALGRAALAPLAVLLALAASTFAPVVVVDASMRRAIVAAMYTTAAACVIMQLLIPPYTRQSPRRINVRYVDDDGSPQWQVASLTPALRLADGFHFRPRRIGEWLSTPALVYASQAPRLSIAAPVVRVVRDEREATRRLTLQLRSLRGANRLSLIVHAPSLAAIRVNGVAPPTGQRKLATSLRPEWQRVTVYGAQQAEIEILLRRDEPIDAIIVDYSSGLPSDGALLVRARDASFAVPSDDGDGVSVLRRLRL
jgi:hypothetical protein